MNEAALHELLSGRQKDLGASLLRGGLRAASAGYSLAMVARNFAYDHGWLERHRVPVPVISVGNITTGGTGKTPIAAWLANWSKAQGRKPGLISRGYRALAVPSNQGTGALPPQNDEKLLLDRLCPGVTHLQQRDRVISSRRAIQEYGCDLLLLDDGFQHRRLCRDLDLVLVDALNPWGYGHVLPRGLLREPLAGLKRADLILITRSDQCTSEQRQELMLQLERYRPTDEVIEVALKPQRLVDLNWQSHALAEVQGKKVMGFCAIGNPEGFGKTIASLGAEVIEVQTYPDHHHYRDVDLSLLADWARAKLNVELVLTTQKDLVKIQPQQWHGPPLLAVEIGMEFLTGESLFKSRLEQLINTPNGT